MQKFVDGTQQQMIALLGVLTGFGYEGICLDTQMQPDGVTPIGPMLVTSLVGNKLEAVRLVTMGFIAAWNYKENEMRSMAADNRRW